MPGRTELKYLVTYRERHELVERWRFFLEKAPYTDEHALYPIRSLYFDSPSLRFYEEKVDGEAVRSKVRLRGYGMHWREMQTCFLEVKRKVGDRLVKFRRNLGAFSDKFLTSDGWGLEADPGLEQAGLLNELYRLRPAVETFYFREAWESSYSHRLRITFDSTLLALFPGQELESHMLLDPAYHCLRDTESVLEIKADEGLPSWVVKAIPGFDLQRRSVSKYAICVEKLNLHRRANGVYV